MERRREVRVDDLAPVVVGNLLQRMADLAADPAGVVDQDVDGADAGEEVPHGGGVGQVGAVLVDLVHVRAVAAERVGDGGADAVRGAGDDRDLACQYCRASQSCRHGAHFPAGSGGGATDARGTRNIGWRTSTSAVGPLSILAMRASTAAPPSSARGMQTLVTGTSRKARHSSSSKLTTETCAGTATPAVTQRGQHPEQLVDAADTAGRRQRAGSQHLPGGVPAAFLGGGRVPDGDLQAQRRAVPAGRAHAAVHRVDVSRAVDEHDAAVPEAGHVVDEQPHRARLVHDDVVAAVGTAPVHVDVRDLAHAGVGASPPQRGGQ